MRSQSQISDDQSISTSEVSATDQQLESYVEAITQENFWNYFATAIRLKNENNFDDAMIILKALMVKGSQIYNSELNISLAEIYFQLGNAALEKLEQGGELVVRDMQVVPTVNNDSTVRSNINGQQQNLRNGHQLNEENSQQSKPSTSGQIQQEQDEDGNEDNEEDVEEIQIAWENLDTCRLIIERYLNEQQNLKEEDRAQLVIKLGSCYQRLGESENYKEDFSSAICEYQKSLEIYESLNRISLLRCISGLHFLIAVALIHENKEKSHEKALEHFIKGKQALESKLDQIKNQSQDNSTENEIILLQDLIRSFDDKILEVKDELEMRETVQTEKKKLQETINSKPNGFAKSEFDENTSEVKNLGKFGCAQKREPSTLLSNEDKPAKKVRLDDQDSGQKSTSDQHSSPKSN